MNNVQLETESLQVPNSASVYPLPSESLDVHDVFGARGAPLAPCWDGQLLLSAFHF